MAFDAFLSPVARRFLDELTPDEREDCRDTIINGLCQAAVRDDPQDPPMVLPFARGISERIVGEWYFRYRVYNATTLQIATIYYRPGHSKYPLLDDMNP